MVYEHRILRYNASMSSGEIGRHEDGVKTQAERLSAAHGPSLRGVFAAVVRSIGSRSCDSGTSRWIVENADPNVAAGSQHVEGVDMDEVFNYARFDCAHRAIVETRGSWSDEQTFVNTMERYHELMGELDEG